MKLLIIAALVAAVTASDIIDGEWMAIVKHNVDEDALSRLLKFSYNVDVQKFYHFKSTTMMLAKAQESDMTRAQQLSEITYVEPNMMFYATQICDNNVACPGVWGIDRVDQIEDLPYTDPASGLATYEWNSASDGSGTRSYVVDTGIRVSHNEFVGRAEWGWNADSLENFDDNGHGTHCAGSVGGTEYGIAKGTFLVAVKVLGRLGGGSTGDIVDGLSFVETDCAGRKCNINMSLGGGANGILDNAVQGCIDAGVTVLAAAGNSDDDACDYSPARVPDAITVGATEVDDQSATYTNWGSCVDVFAPGTDILSSWIGSDSDNNRISGTSMATPHVAGAVARYQSSVGAVPSPAAVAAFITGNATPNTISFRLGHGTSPNLLLHYGC